MLDVGRSALDVFRSLTLSLAGLPSGGHFVGFGNVSSKLLCAFLGLLIEFAEHRFLRRSWPVIGYVNVRRQVSEMIAQLGLKEQAAFARFHRHLRNAVDVAVESGQGGVGLHIG